MHAYTICDQFGIGNFVYTADERGLVFGYARQYQLSLYGKLPGLVRKAIIERCCAFLRQLVFRCSAKLAAM
jgi:hypothetical protein